jgi:hypothetical protein
VSGFAAFLFNRTSDPFDPFSPSKPPRVCAPVKPSAPPRPFSRGRFQKFQDSKTAATNPGKSDRIKPKKLPALTLRGKTFQKPVRPLRFFNIPQLQKTIEPNENPVLVIRA